MTPVVFLLIVGVNWLLTPKDALPSVVLLGTSEAIVSMLLTWPVMPAITKRSPVSFTRGLIRE